MIFYAHECEERIGYTFKDKSILRKCFTHKSYSNEHKEESYEKLEFLGDAILDFIVAEYLMGIVNGDEGDLTKRRSELVSAKPIADAILNLGLEQYVLLGEGERGKAIKMNICSDLFEAIVAGIYLDGGMENAKRFFFDHLLKVKKSKIVDNKSILQELVQKKKLGKIEYRLLNKTGPDHNPEFTTGIYLEGKLLSQGVAGSKKKAEQLAAELAINKIKRQTTKRGKQH